MMSTDYENLRDGDQVTITITGTIVHKSQPVGPSDGIPIDTTRIRDTRGNTHFVFLGNANEELGPKVVTRPRSGQLYRSSRGELFAYLPSGDYPTRPWVMLEDDGSKPRGYSSAIGTRFNSMIEDRIHKVTAP